MWIILQYKWHSCQYSHSLYFVVVFQNVSAPVTDRCFHLFHFQTRILERSHAKSRLIVSTLKKKSERKGNYIYKTNETTSKEANISNIYKHKTKTIN